MDEIQKELKLAYTEDRLHLLFKDLENTDKELYNMLKPSEKHTMNYRDFCANKEGYISKYIIDQENTICGFSLTIL